MPEPSAAAAQQHAFKYDMTGSPVAPQRRSRALQLAMKLRQQQEAQREQVTSHNRLRFAKRASWAPSLFTAARVILMLTVLLSVQAERDVSAAPRGEDEEVSVSAEELRAIEVDAAERAEENSGAAAEEGAGDDDGGDDDGGGGGGGARPAVPTRRPPMVRSTWILLTVSAAL